MRKELQNLHTVLFGTFVTLYLCWFVQSQHHLGPPAEAETDGLVFSHSDAGIRETGESRSQESSPNRCKREGCGGLFHPENTLQTLQLLHREPARYVSSVSLRSKRGKKPIVFVVSC